MSPFERLVRVIEDLRLSVSRGRDERRDARYRTSLAQRRPERPPMRRVTSNQLDEPGRSDER